MKKLFAGILAAVFVLSLSVPVNATTKDITKPVGINYALAAKKPKITLKVVLPAEMKAALNPTGRLFQISEKNTIAMAGNGIVSVAYPVINRDRDYGVFISAAAVTTTSSKDWGVTTSNLTSGTKAANMALVASATEEGIAEYSNKSINATSATDQGTLVLDSSADKTSVQKLAYIPAPAEGETQSVVYLGFAGALAENVVWDFSDNINVNLMLKLEPALKTL